MTNSPWINSSIENVNEITRRIKVSISAERVEDEFEAALNKLAASINIKGFRPGKAPRHLVQSSHGERIRLEVAERLVSSSLSDIVKEQKLDVVGSPLIDMQAIEAGRPIEYTATVSIFPTPQVKDYADFKVTVPLKEPSNAEVDRILENMRESKAALRRIELRNFAKEGDVLDMSLAIELPGEKNVRPEPVVVLLGEGKLPREVESGIVGMEIGSQRVITGRLPDNHRDPKLRGREATYRVTLNAISERVLPPVDDAFAKSLGAGVETLLELRMKIRDSLAEQYKRDAQSEAEAAVLEKLVAKNPFEVPQALIDDEIRSLAVRMGLLDPEKVDVQKLDMQAFREALGEIALKRVRSAILVDRIAEAEKLQAAEDEIEARVKEIASQSEVSEQEVRKFLAQENRLMNLMLEITRNKVMKFLMARTKVEYAKNIGGAEDCKAGESRVQG